MIYKEITFSAAMQMVVEGKSKELFYENENGLHKASEQRYYLFNLKTYKWFKRIPKEAELKKE